MYEYLLDTPFLKELSEQRIRINYAKVVILNWNEEEIETLEGKIISGNINIDGNSSIRRTLSLNFALDLEKNILKDIKNLFYLNKKIKVFLGIKNNLPQYLEYGEIIWFPQGIFVVNQPSVNISASSINISFSAKDKMCLLNGDVSGMLPASVTFHEYNQTIGLYDRFDNITNFDEIPNEDINSYTIYKVNNNYYQWSKEKGWFTSSKSAIGSVVTIKQRIFDIIKTLVQFYGKENLNNIVIKDVALEVKNTVRYTGTRTIYLDNNNEYSYEPNEEYPHFNFNDDIGYTFTDFVFPEELISGFGDTVCSILDKIKTQLGNYEYFYDVEGHFVFQEKKNYINTQWNPIIRNNSSILNNTNYFVSFDKNTKEVYNFDNSYILTSCAVTPNYANIKNDFHIWGNKDNLPIHYHVCIKNKPKIRGWRVVLDSKDNIINCNPGSDEWTKTIKGNITVKDNILLIDKTYYINNDVSIEGSTLRLSNFDTTYNSENTLLLINLDDPNLRPKIYSEDPGAGNRIISYIPKDWRIELYLEGINEKQYGGRPDILHQEVLDYFTPSYYDFIKGEYVQKNPNDLMYFLDFIEPYEELKNYDVDLIDSRTYTYQEDSIKKLYSTNVPDMILINTGMDSYSQEKLREKCNYEGQNWTNVDSEIYKKIGLGTYGVSAESVMRNLIYQYTNFNEVVSLSCIPLYFLEPNTIIYLNNEDTGINGNYLINSMSLSLDSKNTMNINASKIIERM